VKRIYTDTGRSIAVYDDLFDLHYKQEVYAFAQNSLFQIGWADDGVVERQANRFIHSRYSADDMARLGLLERIAGSPAAGEIQGYDFARAVLNLSSAADTNYIHAHAEDKVLLYYVNLEWREGWHGETLFFEENLKDVLFTSVYTPGRLIAFDAKIPHTIRPQSHIAAQYRFTLAMVFNKC